MKKLVLLIGFFTISLLMSADAQMGNHKKYNRKHRSEKSEIRGEIHQHKKYGKGLKQHKKRHARKMARIRRDENRFGRPDPGFHNKMERRMIY
ncbi:MAG: hypothetical protein H7X99_04025 [Saprospiraceae bacterium]|nr:hypothetical protein [Saprospiraceae bacterium]